MNKALTKQSKFLSLVLRHKPETIGIELDDNGWASVEELLQASAKAGQHISKERLDEIVETNNKKRFAFNADKSSIRANQGHSVQSVDLGLQPSKPPEMLYHGTVERFLSSIQESGLQKMQRHHVHLSSTLETATTVGSRRGKPVILKIHAGAMYTEGHEFYISDNGVWLTESVPWKYISNENE